MEQKSQDIFNKITSIEERRKLFTDMVIARTEISCKGIKDEVFKLVCDRYSGEGKMVCNLIKTDSFEPTISSSLVCQFDIGGEKYFFKTTLDFRLKSYVIDMTGDLFHLQRRQSYRIRIPLSTKSAADVIHADTNQNIKAIPFDLSTGGCRLCFNQASLPWKPNDQVKIYLKIGSREPLQLSGVVRHMRNETNPKVCIYVGIQFENITTSIEKSLFSITMDLYREFFSRVES